MFAFVYLLTLGFITTPPTPHDVTTVVDGRTVIKHIDHDTAQICGVRGPWAGCSKMIDGTQHIWVSGVATDDVVKHEEAHKGMQHGEWYLHRYFGNCANITVPYGKYPKDGLVCIDERGRERIVEAGFQDEDCQECLFPDANPHRLMGK